MLPCCTQLLVELGCMRSLSQDLVCAACLRSVLVGRTGDLLSWTYDVTVVARSEVFAR